MIYEDRTSSNLESRAKKTQGLSFSPDQIDSKILQTIPYEYPGQKITACLSTDEFTCICPFSGLPDFAKLKISYVPRKKLIEIKSLKYYLFSYRQVKIYNEHAVNKILNDLNRAVTPHEITITGEFSFRGGIENTVTALRKNTRSNRAKNVK